MAWETEPFSPVSVISGRERWLNDFLSSCIECLIPYHFESLDEHDNKEESLMLVFYNAYYNLKIPGTYKWITDFASNYPTLLPLHSNSCLELSLNPKVNEGEEEIELEGAIPGAYDVVVVQWSIDPYSPSLLEGEDSEYTIPGTYNPSIDEQPLEFPNLAPIFAFLDSVQVAEPAWEDYAFPGSFRWTTEIPMRPEPICSPSPPPPLTTIEVPTFPGAFPYENYLGDKRNLVAPQQSHEHNVTLEGDQHSSLTTSTDSSPEGMSSNDQHSSLAVSDDNIHDPKEHSQTHDLPSPIISTSDERGSKECSEKNLLSCQLTSVSNERSSPKRLEEGESFSSLSGLESREEQEECRPSLLHSVDHLVTKAPEEVQATFLATFLTAFAYSPKGGSLEVPSLPSIISLDRQRESSDSEEFPVPISSPVNDDHNAKEIAKSDSSPSVPASTDVDYDCKEGGTEDCPSSLSTAVSAEHGSQSMSEEQAPSPASLDGEHGTRTTTEEDRLSSPTTSANAEHTSENDSRSSENSIEESRRKLAEMAKIEEKERRAKKEKIAREAAERLKAIAEMVRAEEKERREKIEKERREQERAAREAEEQARKMAEIARIEEEERLARVNKLKLEQEEAEERRLKAKEEKEARMRRDDPEWQAGCRDRFIARQQEELAQSNQGSAAAWLDWTPRRALENYLELSTSFDNAKFNATLTSDQCSAAPSFKTIPWPVLKHPSQIMLSDIHWTSIESFFSTIQSQHLISQVEYRSLVIKSHLRFHPDKWRSRRVLSGVVDEEERLCLEYGANLVAQALAPIRSAL